MIIGGGIAGLASAWHLAQEGRDVAVIDAGHPGAASTAAAGMLTPGCEWHDWMPMYFLDLLIQGREYYPEFLAKLVDTASRVGYRETAYLNLDIRERDPENMARQTAALQAAGLDVTPLDLRQTLRHEPEVNLDPIRGSLLIRGEAVVDPRALQGALREGVAAHGGIHVPDTAAHIADEGRRFVVTTAEGHRFSAERLVLAAGAWTPESAALVNLDLPVTPLRGQMIQLHGRPGVVHTIVYMASGACGSIVERYPGVYIVGTSEELTSGEAATTPAVVIAILGRACSVLPALGSMSIAAMWAGFRPVTPDQMPVIGAVNGGRIVITTGHYRNGILLGPLTGRIVCDLVTGRTPPVDLSPYRPDRAFRTQYRFVARY